MSNKTQLQTNNTALDALITRVNAAKDTAASLPEAGSGGTGNNMITVTCESYSHSSVYYFDASGMVQEAEPNTTFSALTGIVFYLGTASFLTSKGEAVATGAPINSYFQAFVFHESGGCYVDVGGFGDQ